MRDTWAFGQLSTWLARPLWHCKSPLLAARRWRPGCLSGVGPLDAGALRSDRTRVAGGTPPSSAPATAVPLLSASLSTTIASPASPARRSSGGRLLREAAGATDLRRRQRGTARAEARAAALLHLLAEAGRGVRATTVSGPLVIFAAKERQQRLRCLLIVVFVTATPESQTI